MMKRMKMMITNEDLLVKWNSISHYDLGFLRIDAEHPIEWYIGYENINQKLLLLVSVFEPETVPSSKSILVSIGQRADGKWAIAFRLIRNEQEDVFIRLCCDLIESSRNQPNNIHGLDFVLKRYNQWTKLMEIQKAGLLSEAQRKGLLGEILYLQETIQKNGLLIDDVSGWVGPEGADQDFIYTDGWHEIKVVGLSANSVSISSLEQFNAQLPGELVLYLIDKTAQDDKNGFTLKEVIDSIRELLQSNSAATDLFNEKLLRYGYIDLPEYEKQYYRLGGEKKFFIDDHFPRLVKSNVPAQIVGAVYQISIQAIEPWKVD